MTHFRKVADLISDPSQITETISGKFSLVNNVVVLIKTLKPYCDIILFNVSEIK